jgi:DNA-binding transcriptional LysR family regulator
MTSIDLEARLLSQLRLRQLQLVCALMETGNLRLSAERIHVSPPAASKSLRELETLIGMQLFERSRTGLRPASGAESFLRGAQNMLMTLRETVAELRVEVPNSRLIVRLGTLPFLGWSLVPRMLAAVEDHGRSLHANIVEGRLVPLAEQLLMGDVDMLLTMCTPQALAVLKSEPLVIETLRLEPIVVVGTKRPKRKLDWQSLAAERWILPPQPTHIRTVVDAAFLAAGVPAPEPAIESLNLLSSIRLAEAGLGVTPVPLSAIQSELASRKLVCLNLEEPLPSVPIALVYRRASADRSSILAVRTALDMLRENPRFSLPAGG